MIILGINAYHGDVSAALLQEGRLVAAVEEERFRRVKHWAGFPSESMRTCLKMAGISPSGVDHFAVSRNPRANLIRKAAYSLRHTPDPALVVDRARNARRILGVADRIARELGLPVNHVRGRLRWVEHHPTHLASAFFVSPFDDAAVCAMDGFGDFVSTSFAVGKSSRLELLNKIYFPHSLGILYLGLTQYLGFPKYGDEYKVMGLAAYGQPEYAEALRRLIRWGPGATLELDLAYFRHHLGGGQMSWDDGEPTLSPVYTKKLEELLGPARKPNDPIQPRHEAVAASLQRVFEEAVFHLLNVLHQKTGASRLCLAGGCAMNSAANGKIREKTPFKEIYIQPAAADNGTSLGAACYVQHQLLRQPRRFVMEHAYWGPEFTPDELRQPLKARGADLARQGCRILEMPDEQELCRRVAQQISEGKIAGWFQGRMEWGPRALGNRSILADPRRPNMREIINTKIKFREQFRPFAPSILEEALHDYFVGAVPDPFMIQVYPVRPEKRSVIPAVTHADGSGRLQTVRREHNPLYWKLLKAFEALTGVPVLLNTSFNENEPIVHRPEEALDCFLRTNMDILVLGNHLLEKGAR